MLGTITSRLSRLAGSSMIARFFMSVICRLTVSMVMPRKLAISARESGREKCTPPELVLLPALGNQAQKSRHALISGAPPQQQYPVVASSNSLKAARNKTRSSPALRR